MPGVTTVSVEYSVVVSPITPFLTIVSSAASSLTPVVGLSCESVIVTTWRSTVVSPVAPSALSNTTVTNGALASKL